MAKARSSNVEQILRNKGDAIDESVDPDLNTDLTREERIRLAAYAAAERRGFQPGFDTDDWLEAERQVDAAEGEGDAAPGAR